MSNGCKCYESVPLGAVCWSPVCDCGISLCHTHSLFKNDADSIGNYLHYIVIAYVPLSCADARLKESTCLLGHIRISSIDFRNVHGSAD